MIWYNHINICIFDMYICVCFCMSVYTCIYIYTYIYICVHTHIYIRIIYCDHILWSLPEVPRDLPQCNSGLPWHIPVSRQVPSGKHTKNYGKSPFLTGKSTISMAIFHSYVLPEGRDHPKEQLKIHPLPGPVPRFSHRGNIRKCNHSWVQIR